MTWYSDLVAPQSKRHDKAKPADASSAVTSHAPRPAPGQSTDTDNDDDPSWTPNQTQRAHGLAANPVLKPSPAPRAQGQGLTAEGLRAYISSTYGSDPDKVRSHHLKSVLRTTEKDPAGFS